MTPQSGPPVIFDMRRRTAQRERAGTRNAPELFLWQRIADELQDRLDMVTRQFDDVLIIGPLAPWAKQILGNRTSRIHTAALCRSELQPGGVLIEAEDRMPFTTSSFDVIITAGTLDSVNDLPGALVQMRHFLRPDGLLLVTMFGAGTLATLKSMMLAAAADQVQPHIHPQIELKLAADLLVRAGFALPVADLDPVSIRYRDWRRLTADIRDMGIGNALTGQRHYLGKDFIARLDQAWHSRADDDGRMTEQFNLLHLSGWSPSPDQPKPAKRGSGTVSLISAIGKGETDPNLQ